MSTNTIRYNVCRDNSGLHVIAFGLCSEEEMVQAIAADFGHKKTIIWRARPAVLEDRDIASDAVFRYCKARFFVTHTPVGAGESQYEFVPENDLTAITISEIPTTQEG